MYSSPSQIAHLQSDLDSRNPVPTVLAVQPELYSKLASMQVYWELTISLNLLALS
jgi:hypothetical protein